MVVNSPATRIWPEGCSAMALTTPFALGLKPLSTDPSWFRRAM